MKKLASSDKKSEHVRVYVRARPLQDGEAKAPISLTDRDVAAKAKNSRGQSNYSFKKVFNTNSTQEELFETACKPLVADMLKGFSCTIFAYGQTNSGKTHSMMGDLKSETLQGLTPRACKHIFNELMKSSAHFTVRLSCVELYKEEFYDMLVPTDAEKKPKLKLFQDGNKGVVMKGVEEIVVSSPSDVIGQLETAINRRATAATGMNSRSSRSHFIATISVTVKEETMNGEDIFKMGKLHLVDLAGSESAKRTDTAGTDRQSEAAAINKSLLTLGRVISSLSQPDNSHTPYRESALTRLLQDALGGKSKTSIITTISLAKQNIDETLSTLEYASSARKIENDPEMNRVLSGNQVVCDYENELNRLRLELTDQRNGTGVYVSEDRYEMMQNRLKELEADQVLKSEKVTELQEKLGAVQGIIDDLKARHLEKNVLLHHHQQSEAALADCIQANVNKEEGLRAVMNTRDQREEKNFQTIDDHIGSQIENVGALEDEIKTSSSRLTSLMNESVQLVSSACHTTTESISGSADAVVKQEETTTQLFTALEDRINTLISTQQHSFDVLKSNTNTAQSESQQMVSQLGAQVEQSSVATTEKHCKKVSAAMDDVMGKFLNASAAAGSSDRTELEALVKDMLASLKEEVVGSMKEVVSEVNSKAVSRREAASALTAGSTSRLSDGCNGLSSVMAGTEQGVKMTTDRSFVSLTEDLDAMKVAYQEHVGEDFAQLSNQLFSLEERERAAVRVATESSTQAQSNIDAANAKLWVDIQNLQRTHKEYVDQQTQHRALADLTLRQTLSTITQERVDARTELAQIVNSHEERLAAELHAVLEAAGESGDRLSEAVCVEVKKANAALKGLHSSMEAALKQHVEVHESADSAASQYLEGKLAVFEEVTGAGVQKAVGAVDTLGETKMQQRVAMAEQVKQAVEGAVLASSGEVTQEVHVNNQVMKKGVEQVCEKVAAMGRGVVEAAEAVVEGNAVMKRDVDNVGRMGMEKASEVAVEAKGALAKAVDLLVKLDETMVNGMQKSGEGIMEGMDAGLCVTNRMKEEATYLNDATTRHERGMTPSPARRFPHPTKDYNQVLGRYSTGQIASATATPVPKASTLPIYVDPMSPPTMDQDEDNTHLERRSTRKSMVGTPVKTPLGLINENTMM